MINRLRPANLRSTILAGLGFGLLAACATTGVGLGTGHFRYDTSDKPVNFQWKADGKVSGTMTATLDDGESFSGPFFQITRETRGEILLPLWTGWRWGWEDWPMGGIGATPTFETQYSGKVVANLDGQTGHHMRCRFDLVHPSTGMSGGGSGECQLSHGGPDGAPAIEDGWRSIDATFPAA
jgi:hypothetical protein